MIVLGVSLLRSHGGADGGVHPRRRHVGTASGVRHGHRRPEALRCATRLRRCSGGSRLRARFGALDRRQHARGAGGDRERPASCSFRARPVVRQQQRRQRFTLRMAAPRRVYGPCSRCASAEQATSPRGMEQALNALADRNRTTPRRTVDGQLRSRRRGAGGGRRRRRRRHAACRDRLDRRRRTLGRRSLRQASPADGRARFGQTAAAPARRQLLPNRCRCHAARFALTGAALTMLTKACASRWNTGSPSPQ